MTDDELRSAAPEPDKTPEPEGKRNPIAGFFKGKAGVIAAVAALVVVVAMMALAIYFDGDVYDKAAMVWIAAFIIDLVYYRSVRKGAAIVAMCIEGKQISSDELAQFLADRANSGAGDVAFVIGSSHGLSDEVKKAAALKFSMGRITMPHQLARLVLTEQIYRACTINAGMKYHK